MNSLEANFTIGWSNGVGVGVGEWAEENIGMGFWFKGDVGIKFGEAEEFIAVEGLE